MQIVPLFLAQAAQQSGGMMPMLVTMTLVFGIFYFMMIRPQQRKEKDRQKVIAELREKFDWVHCDSPAGIERGPAMAMPARDPGWPPYGPLRDGAAMRGLRTVFGRNALAGRLGDMF